MGGNVSRVCVAIDDEVLRRRVHRALSGTAHRLMEITSIAAAGSMRRVGSEQLLLVVGSRVGGYAMTPAAIAQLRLAEPLVPIILCLTPPAPLLHRLGELAIAGVDRIVVLDGPDTEEDLRLRAKEALGHILPPDLDLGVQPALRDRGSAIVLFCIRNGYWPITERVIADVFACNRSQVLKSVKRLGWPDAQHLIGLARLIWVALELDKSGATTINSVARSLRFSSADALHKRIRRLTGLNAHELKFGGRMQVVLASWQRRGAADRG